MSPRSTRPIRHAPVTLPTGFELTPERVEYVDLDKVLVSLKTKTGEVVTYTMKTASMVHLVNLSVGLINNCTAQVFRDLGVL